MTKAIVLVTFAVCLVFGALIGNALTANATFSGCTPSPASTSR